MLHLSEQIAGTDWGGESSERIKSWQCKIYLLKKNAASL